MAKGKEAKPDTTRVRRFGEIARDLGFCSMEEIEYALAVQRAMKKEYGRARPVGVLLIRLGYMTRAEVHQVLSEMAAEHQAYDGRVVIATADPPSEHGEDTRKIERR